MEEKKWEGKRGHGHIDEIAPVWHLMAVQALWPWGKDPMTVWGPTTALLTETLILGFLEFMVSQLSET